MEDEISVISVDKYQNRFKNYTRILADSDLLKNQDFVKFWSNLQNGQIMKALIYVSEVNPTVFEMEAKWHDVKAMIDFLKAIYNDFRELDLNETELEVIAECLTAIRALHRVCIARKDQKYISDRSRGEVIPVAY